MIQRFPVESIQKESAQLLVGPAGLGAESVMGRVGLKAAGTPHGVTASGATPSVSMNGLGL